MTRGEVSKAKLDDNCADMEKDNQGEDRRQDSMKCSKIVKTLFIGKLRLKGPSRVPFHNFKVNYN